MNETERMDLVQKIDEMLTALNLRLAAAESCTGGLLGNIITNLSGVSRSFLGGVISYDNSIKHKLLGVEEKILQNCGAVSRETAAQMAHGIRIACSTEEIPAEHIVGVSITGIAGPLGGSAGKPVGLVWIGVESAWGSETLQYFGSSGREGNKQQFADQALIFVLKHLNTINSKTPSF